MNAWEVRPAAVSFATENNGGGAYSSTGTNAVNEDSAKL